MSFWVTTDPSDSFSYGVNNSNTTNSSGYAVFYFDPTCNYGAGPAFWFGGTNYNTCYAEDNQTEGSQAMTIVGQLKNNLDLPNSSQTTFNVTNNITIRFNVSTDCIALDGLLNETTRNITLIHNTTGQKSQCRKPDQGKGSG